MSKYAKGAIVKHQSGEIRGQVTAVFSREIFPPVTMCVGMTAPEPACRKELNPGDEMRCDRVNLSRPAS